MKVIDKIKKSIFECTHPMEMAGILDGIKVASIFYCLEHCSGEIIYSGGEII